MADERQRFYKILDCVGSLGNKIKASISFKTDTILSHEKVRRRAALKTIEIPCWTSNPALSSMYGNPFVIKRKHFRKR